MTTTTSFSTGMDFSRTNDFYSTCDSEEEAEALNDHAAKAIKRCEEKYGVTILWQTNEIHYPVGHEFDYEALLADYKEELAKAV